MNLIFLYLFMGLGLSMDAFSLAIVYGTNNLSIKKMFILSLVVGLFHFFMPNLGSILSISFLTKFVQYGDLITGIVFLILTIEMIISLKEEEIKYQLTSYLEIILFATAVSIDSFSLGMALSLSKNNLILAGMIFAIVSFIFTLIGLFLGKYLNKKIGIISKIIGILILLFFTIKYLL